MSESAGAGRARGRARGTAPPGASGGGDSPTSSGSGGSGSARGGAAQPSSGNTRGRAGYFNPLRTLPRAITQTSGEGGTNVKLMCNFFRVKPPTGALVHDYRVEFEPNIETPIGRRKMLTEHAAAIGTFTFDGKSNLKSLKKLPEVSNVFQSINPTTNEPVQILVNYTGDVDWGTEEMLRLLNMIMNRNLRSLKYILMGRHYYDPARTIPIPEHALSMWQGVSTAIHPHDGGLMLCCDTVFKVVRKETALEVLRRCFGQDRDRWQVNATHELSNQIVLTSYNNKTYRVGDINFEKNPTNYEFEQRNRDGTTTTVNLIQYYKERHHVEIKDPKQPLLIVKKDKRELKRLEVNNLEDREIILIPELCQLTGLSDSLAGDFNVRRALTQKTQQVPVDRIKSLHTFMAKVNSNEEVRKDLGEWGVEYEGSPVTLPGRVLENQPLYMGTNDQPIQWEQRKGDFSGEMRSKRLKVAPPRYAKWVIISSERDKRNAQEFAETLNRVAGPMGVEFSAPRTIALPDDRTASFANAVRNIDDDAQMVVTILPNNNKDRYDVIKKILCCDKPIPSQCVVGKTLMNKQRLMSVCTKICIQMAAKSGGEPWALTIPAKDTMIVGYDTYHDSAQRGLSVGGFVCTLNQTCTRYFSKVSFHKDYNEMSANFTINIIDSLKRYHQVNDRLPKRIVIYRDGVSEGQIDQVYVTELEGVKKALREMGLKIDDPNDPDCTQLAFVIVTKRINARFFKLTGPQQAENPGPGTIVDTVVTRPHRFDFYLVAQSVRQGTVAPTHFNVIEENTGKWGPKHHQMMAYKLCHLYFNWQGTVRVPAPCQYAHKLAFLVGTSLHRDPSDVLSEKLYFL